MRAHPRAMSPTQRNINAAAKSATDWIGSVSSLIVHTALFIASFSLVFFGIDFDKILLTVTTIVSLEAIYLAIFIQMAINQQAQSLEDVEENIDEIQEKVVEIHKDVDEIEKDVDEIQKDVDEIQEDVDEIQENVDEIQEDVDEIQEDVTEEDVHHREQNAMLDKIEGTLGDLMKEIEKMKASK